MAVQAKIAITGLAMKCAALEAENRRLQKEVLNWEDREAACCPEDYGFEEVIKSLREENERLRQALGPVTDEENKLYFFGQRNRGHVSIMLKERLEAAASSAPASGEKEE